MQEFLVGTEYVVDTVSRDGNHKVLNRPLPERATLASKYSSPVSPALSFNVSVYFALR